LAAVPSIGRATRVEPGGAPGVDAASELYERYSHQLLGYCLHQLGSREEAEDAVQTTFMNAFRGLARGIVPECEQAWLFKIAHNVCLSRRRSSWRRGRVEAPNNLEVLQEIVPAKEKIADELIPLQDVLEELPVNQRRAILLREWQGLSYREVADELGVSQAAVETLIFRARRSLAAGLQEAPAGSLRKRLRRGADVGGLLAFVKTLFGGGGAAAVKAVAVIALAGAAVATSAAEHMGHQSPSPRTPIVRPTVGARSGSAAFTPGGAAVSTLRGLDPAARVHGNGASRADARVGAQSSTASAHTAAKAHGQVPTARVGSAKPLPNASSGEAAAAPEQQGSSGRSAANHPSKPASASPNAAKSKAKAKGASAAPADPPSTGDTHPNRGNGAQTGRPPSPDTTASGSADDAGKAKTDADGNANPNANGGGPPQAPPGQSSDPHGNPDHTK
jgi:RNA polymerase sigma factor (sigma-70 family)